MYGKHKVGIGERKGGRETRGRSERGRLREKLRGAFIFLRERDQESTSILNDIFIYLYFFYPQKKIGWGKGFLLAADFGN